MQYVLRNLRQGLGLGRRSNSRAPANLGPSRASERMRFVLASLVALAVRTD